MAGLMGPLWMLRIKPRLDKCNTSTLLTVLTLWSLIVAGQGSLMAYVNWGEAKELTVLRRKYDVFSHHLANPRITDEI